MTWFGGFEVAVNDLTTVQRVLASLATGAVLAGVLALARREVGRRDSRVVDVLVGGVGVATLAAAGVVVVVVWNLEAQAQDALRDLKVQAKLVGSLALTVGFFVAVYVGTGFVHQTIERFMKQREGITDHQAEVTYRIIQISLYVLAVVAVLGFWGIKLGGLLIGAGFAGIVLGMAARQTLGAVIAGLVLMFSRPFEIGDWVKIGDNDGIVTDITIVNTRLQTFDGEYVMLPNDYVGSSEVVNRSRKGRLRIHVEVGVDYGSDVDEAMDVAKDAMGDVEDVLTVPRPQVVLKEFGASAVVLDLRFWIDKPSARRRWRAQTAVISAVKSAFDEAGVKIPFPQREVSGRAETGGFRVREQPPGEGGGEPAEGERDAESAVERVEGEDD
ncbi:MAG: mechanosensitive ion channel family protein [Halobacterium sp.]